jgi:predicted nucleic acid-binding protein
MPFVVDASVASCWAFDDEAHPVATRTLDRMRKDEALVPALWWFEIRNVLIVNERRKRIARAGVSAFLRNLSRLSIVIDRAPDEAPLLELARQHRLSVYDAAYLELAKRERIALATLDGELAEAARAEKVALVG